MLFAHKKVYNNGCQKIKKKINPNMAGNFFFGDYDGKKITV